MQACNHDRHHSRNSMRALSLAEPTFYMNHATHQLCCNACAHESYTQMAPNSHDGFTYVTSLIIILSITLADVHLTDHQCVGQFTKG